MTPNSGSSSTIGTPPTNRPRSANQAPAAPIQFAGLPPAAVWIAASVPSWVRRSEEHTSELQSLMRISYAVFCLKKKKKKQQIAATRTLKTMTQHTHQPPTDNNHTRV